MRPTLLAALLFASTALSAELVQRDVVIKTNDGRTVTGRLISELSKGYLVRVGDESIVFEFSEIAELTDAPAGTAPTPPPPDASGCTPVCRAGFLCHEAQCISACNPACAGEDVCTSDARCVSRDEAEEHELRIARAAQLARIEDGTRGLHFGATAELVGAFSVGGFIGPLLNIGLGMLQLRTSLGLDLQGHWGAWFYAERGVFAFVQLRQEALFYLTSRYGLGLGFTAGLGSAGGRLTPEIGVRLMPAFFRLGDRRNLELGVVLSASYLAKIGGPTDPLGGYDPWQPTYAIGGGFTFTWLVL